MSSYTDLQPVPKSFNNRRSTCVVLHRWEKSSAEQEMVCFSFPVELTEEELSSLA